MSPSQKGWPSRVNSGGMCGALKALWLLRKGKCSQNPRFSWFTTRCHALVCCQMGQWGVGIAWLTALRCKVVGKRPKLLTFVDGVGIPELKCSVRWHLLIASRVKLVLQACKKAVQGRNLLFRLVLRSQGSSVLWFVQALHGNLRPDRRSYSF